jgi:hypothetical protein
MAKEPKKKLPKKRDPKKRQKFLNKNPHSKYYDYAFHHLDEIRAWSMEGMKLSEMARALEVGAATINSWIEKHVEFKLAIREGRERAKHDVEGALIRRALGYDLKNVETTTVTDGEGNVVQRVEKQNTKHIPADVRAMEFFLKNRDSERWNKSSNDVNISGGVLLVPTTDNDDWSEMVRKQQETLAKSAEKTVKEVIGMKTNVGDDEE